ncbi:MAG: hypothetical protein MK524_05585 [SAR202 cluster bacterium]|nr:hypothetical protein [SAR202 cluster bacterium]
MLDDQQNERRRVQGRDPRAFYQGMNEGRLAQGSMDDWVMALRFFFRLVTLPIWLPYKGWKIIRLRREMAEFAAARGRNLIIGDRAVREVTLAWVEDHPHEFVLGEYDPAVTKLQSAFKKLMDRRR